MRNPHDFALGADTYRDGRGGSTTGSGRRPYPSIKELQDMAASLSLDEHASLNQLVSTAEESLQKARSLTQGGQLDFALVQYLRASEITINTIPSHPDFSYINRTHPRWSDRFAALLMGINSYHAVMENVKQQIIADNMSRSRSRPTSRAGYSSTPTESAQNSQTVPYYCNSTTVEPPLRMPSPSNFQTPSSSPRTGGRQPTSPQRSPSDDPLAQRFAQLRNSRYNETPTIYDRNGARQNSPSDSSATHSLPFSGHRPSSQGSLPRQLEAPSSRLMGPRPMNSSHQSGPAVPPKIPLEPLNATLPRCPSPAYSPSRTIPSQPPPNPPRTSMDSTRSSLYRQNSSWAGTPNGHLSGSFEENPYRSHTPNGFHTEGDSKAPPPYLQIGPTITAEQLLECLRKAELLLIDVRPRTEFDSGHIMAKSVICIEPVILKEGVSAEELEERLVISPETELSLFSRRDEFDLIVYYDQNTREPSYLAGSPAGTSMPHLRALYDTLYEFNMYKPLKGGRQPSLLVGGIDAWVDLLGPQSLATSHTAAALNSIRAGKAGQRQGPTIRRVPTASANSSWEVKKRRLREYRPLDKDEERVWLEKAKNEEIDPTSYPSLAEDPERVGDGDQEALSPFARTYEDFLRRFPDPRDIRESMVAPARREPPPPLQDPIMIAPPSRPPPTVPRPSYGGVSDGRPIQPPLARQNSATKHPLYISTSPLDRLKLPRTGLVNLGSTCYMNSIIQSLSATRQLTMFFMDNRFHTQVQKNWKGSQGVLPGLYANLIRSLWKGDVEVIRPTSFRKFIGRLNAEWAGSEQQDAKEFFDVLIDCLHEDLNVNFQRKPIEPLTFEQEMRRERMPIHRVSTIEWQRYSHRELSYISSLFAGQHASRLRCTTCRNTSTTYEAFFSISVEIPTSGTGDIYQCLRSYTQEEMLSNDDVWKCPHCRCEREATKQIILTRAPRFLVIHFKRFSASKRQQARKIHTPVNFPLTGFDLTPFMIPPPSQPQPPRNGDGQSSPAPPPPQCTLSPMELATSPPYIYNAYAVVRHLGSTIHEGHYISLVRDNARDCWRKFDDQRVTDFKPGNSRADNPANEQAYLVFYERVMVN
ncbi:hypothetical protein VTO42DRAFT_8326 [Malbranchea cinnamomea]